MRTLSLLECQRTLAAFVVEPSLAAKPSAAALLGAILRAPQSLQPADAVGIYSGGYPARIREALLDTYPAVAAVVGEEAFTDLALTMIEMTPPDSKNLNDAGRALPPLLASALAGSDVVRRYPFLADLALLEWRIVEAFHAAVGEPADFSAAAGWTPAQWEATRLRFQAGTAVVRSKWPIQEIWSRRERPPAEIAAYFGEKSETLLVRRRGLEVRIDVLEDGEAAALEMLMAGASLGDALGKLAERGVGSAAVLGWFSRWNGAGLIAGYSRD